MANVRRSVILLLFVSIILSSCNKGTGKIIIVTGTPPANPLIPSSDQQIRVLDPSRSSGSKLLTEDFFSACSPVISADGRLMVFSGRKNENDPWQIWEMKLTGRNVRQIIKCNENCLFPSYLPGDWIVFSRMLQDDTIKSSLALFRCKSDGSIIERITFNPAEWFASTILTDGRILAKCIRQFPSAGEPQLMVLRPDGTKAELFCSNSVSLNSSKAVETSDGNIIFVESHGSLSSINSIAYNNPSGKTTHITEGMTGEFIYISPGNDNKIITCYRSSPSEKFRLIELEPDNPPGRILYASKDYDILEAIAVKPGSKPKRLPSEVDKLVKTGLLLCQDINVTDPEPPGNPQPANIEIIGINASYGIVKPEPDGSFNLKVISDTPFRIVTLDEKGQIIKRCSWLFLRPNERRGCTGCHEKSGIVPENRIPLAVKKEPVLIPVHITRIDEKTVELE